MYEVLFRRLVQSPGEGALTMYAICFRSHAETVVPYTPVYAAVAQLGQSLPEGMSRSAALAKQHATGCVIF